MLLTYEHGTMLISCCTRAAAIDLLGGAAYLDGVDLVIGMNAGVLELGLIRIASVATRMQLNIGTSKLYLKKRVLLRKVQACTSGMYTSTPCIATTGSCGTCTIGQTV